MNRDEAAFTRGEGRGAGSVRRAPALLVALGVGCSAPAPATIQSPRDEFLDAVAATSNPADLHETPPLVRIVPDDSDSIWNDRGEVLVATLTSLCDVKEALEAALVPENLGWDPVDAIQRDGQVRCRLHPGVEEIMAQLPIRELPVYAWVTSPPELRRHCATLWSESLRWSANPDEQDEQISHGLKRWLGLAPEGLRDVVVEYWVRPKWLFRPCVDGAIASANCASLVPTGVTANGPDVWRCGSDLPAPNEFGTRAHWRWMCDWWGCSHGKRSNELCRQRGESDGLPWTSLGYSWDWSQHENPTDRRRASTRGVAARPAAFSHVGASEFVIQKSAPYRFASITAVAMYCATPHTDN